MNAFFTYLKDSKDELLHKVTWPKWADLQKNTIVVAVSALIFALLTTGIDAVFSNAIQGLVKVLQLAF